MGLVQAARKFDPVKKVKFSYYASFWIKAYIHKYLMNNHRSVRIGTTQSQRKLFYNFKKTKTSLMQEGVQPTAEEISKRLNVPKRDVIEMQQRLEHPDISLNDPLRSREHEEIVDKLISSATAADEKIEEHQLQAAGAGKRPGIQEAARSPRKRDPRTPHPGRPTGNVESSGQ